MTRLPLLLLLALAACERAPPPPVDGAAAEVWQAGNRDRLCLKGSRGGFIVYGPGNANCSARGHAIRSDTSAAIIPDGEGACAFVITLAGDGASLRVGPASGRACDYYCGPGARLDRAMLTRAPAGTTATDNGGDPLC